MDKRHIKTKCTLSQKIIGRITMTKHDLDLRVIKTRKAIKDAFCEMIMEMDYDKITIKELTGRAMINRNTFYLHYDSIDALMKELQSEIIERFIQENISYRNMSDIKSMIRLFFSHASTETDLNERLLCCGSYQFVYDEINKAIMEYRRETNRGVFEMDEASESIVFTYFGSVSAILYRQWVADGKKLSVKEITDLATRLICEGMQSVVTK